MPLKVIGAGLPRSGTNSLSEALDLLGFRTHHMKYLVMDPSLCQKWADLTTDLKPASPSHFDSIFTTRFDATVDFPSSYHWEALAETYPEAKVILSVRSAEGWAKSFMTLEAFLAKLFGRLGLMRFVGITRFYKWRLMCDALHCTLFYGKDGRFAKQLPTAPSTDEMVVRYNKWTEHVKATCPKDRLLVFDVREGWAPLCKFLQLPVPEVPFPHSNAGGSGLSRLAWDHIVVNPLRRLFGLPVKKHDAPSPSALPEQD